MKLIDLSECRTYSSQRHADLRPVVQSIVSLTTSGRRQLVKYMWLTLSITLLFLLEKCENHLLTFFNEKITAYLWY